jgi:hypothetical protein
MKICFASFGSLVAMRGLSISLGALALAAFLVGNHSRNSRLQDDKRGQASVATVAVHSRDGLNYFRSGMWLADLRTLMAVCWILVDPDLA